MTVEDQSSHLEVVRPGISSKMLADAGVRRVNAVGAERLCGLAEPGLWLPYRALDGAPILEGGKAYGRLRMDRPQESKKYHQAFGTGVHGYVTPGLSSVAPGDDLFVIEGEFKALSLMEAGFPTMGISGFFGFAAKGGEALVTELAVVIERLRPARVFFCGDSDTALNHQFAVAAVRVLSALSPLDQRASIREAFRFRAEQRTAPTPGSGWRPAICRSP